MYDDLIISAFGQTVYKNAILKIIKITIDDLNIALWYTNNIQVSIANHKV